MDLAIEPDKDNSRRVSLKFVEMSEPATRFRKWTKNGDMILSTHEKGLQKMRPKFRKN